jgi:hypothetical protein
VRCLPPCISTLISSPSWQPLGIATRLVQSAFAGASSSAHLSFEVPPSPPLHMPGPAEALRGGQEFRRWIVETELFLIMWSNVFDPYEASGFRSPMEVPVFVPTVSDEMYTAQ